MNTVPGVVPLELDFDFDADAPPQVKPLDLDLDLVMDTNVPQEKPFSFSDSEEEEEESEEKDVHMEDGQRAVPDVLPEHDLRTVPPINHNDLRENGKNVAQAIDKVFVEPVRKQYAGYRESFAPFADEDVDTDVNAGIDKAASELVVIINKRRPEKYASECVALPWSFVDEVLLVYHTKFVQLDGAMVRNIGPCSAGMECQGALAASVPDGPVHLAVYRDQKKFAGGPLVQLVTPEEHAAWKRSRGTLRLPPRMCIFCYWQSIIRTVGIAEYNKVALDENIAAFVVPTNCEDGYNRNLCLGPSEKSISGLHGFIPLMQYTLLSIDYREATGTWFINHKSFKYDMGTECYPPPSAEVARRLLDTRVSHLTMDVTSPAPELRGDTIFSQPSVPGATPRNMKAISHMSPAGQATVLGK